MKSLLHRVVKLEQHAETFPIDLPPLPPSGASEEELERAAQEALQQFYAHPQQLGWYLHLIQIVQQVGLTSQKGRELFCDDAEQEAAASTTTTAPQIGRAHV